jgi:hypothetical protein
LDVIEADSFWCLSKLLDGIQVIEWNPFESHVIDHSHW